jgi:phage terminase large subunit-like protein
MLTPDQIKQLHGLSIRDCIQYWDDLENIGRRENKLAQVVRLLVQADLYYLLVRVCGRVDMLPCVNRDGYVDNEFAFRRCRMVEDGPNGYLDLWGREHFKSSVITFGLTIQDILKDPEITFGIFSHTRPIAKAFLRQIMRELESNKTLHAAFPDVLWGENIKLAQKWSEDDGIIVKRKSNPNEATVEAWGLVDGQPTSKHYRVLLYDDVVVAGSVTTPDMIGKTMVEMERSYNLGTTPGIKRGAGTRWHFNDAYKTIVDRGTFKGREHPGKIGGTEDGESVFWSDAVHKQKRRDMGPYTYAAQILLNPKADAMQGFKREWLRYYKKINPKGMNGYILVDSANSKKKESDYTAMWAVLLGLDKNYYAYKMIRDRLNLTERTHRLIDMHRKLRADGVNIIQVRYEKYGLMGDIEHIKTEQEAQNYRFDITEVGGQTSKDDRIKRLIPIFEQGRFYLMETLHVSDWQKNVIDLVQSFIEEEYFPFPVGLHRDGLDSLARIAEPDLTLVWPMEEKPDEAPPKQRHYSGPGAWMGG